MWSVTTKTGECCFSLVPHAPAQEALVDTIRTTVERQARALTLGSARVIALLFVRVELTAADLVALVLLRRERKDVLGKDL